LPPFNHPRTVYLSTSQIRFLMKKFTALYRTLKDGRTVLIREGQPADAAALLATIKTYLHDSDCIPLRPEEFSLGEEEERAWIQSLQARDNSLLLVAVGDGQVVGNIDLTGSPRQATRHTGVIGMGLLKEWRGSGLGTELLRSVVQWARTNPALEKLWLQVYATNLAGRTLYHKAGFEECGVQKDFFKREDGLYADNVTMMLDVK
jgi:RimJ/RimL family protein N-acetyltransferase